MYRVKDLFINTKVEDVVKEMISYYSVEKLPEYIAEYIRIRNLFFTEQTQNILNETQSYTLDFSKLPGHNNFLISLHNQSDVGKEYRKTTYWGLLAANISDNIDNKFHHGEIIAIIVPKIISLGKSYMMDNVEVMNDNTMEDMFIDAMQTNLVHKEEIYHKLKVANDSKLAEFKQKGLV